MRRLFVANTHFQIINAIHLNSSLFADDTNVLIISDHSRGSRAPYECLCQMDVFEKVLYVENRELVYNYCKIDAIKDFINITLKDSNRFSYYLDDLENLLFDEICVYTLDPDVYGLFSILSNYNAKLKVSIYAESTMSNSYYVYNTRLTKISNYIRRAMRKPVIALGNFYCFYPELYEGDLNVVRIPLIKAGGTTARILAQAYSVDPEKNYDRKYILFTSMGDCEGNSPIGEFDLFMRIADLVGKENIIVKEHPRDVRGLYEKNGFLVDRASNIPWEAIVLNNSIKGKIFISTISTSALSGNLLSDIKNTTYYMYKMCDLEDNVPVNISVNAIKKAKLKGILDEKSKVIIADNIEDVLSE